MIETNLENITNWSSFYRASLKIKK
jgi:hypothetical protein